MLRTCEIADGHVVNNASTSAQMPRPASPLRPLALPHAPNRHHPDLFQRVVIKPSPIALHDESYVSRNTKATKLQSKLATY
jgi:hypothetical protein